MMKLCSDVLAGLKAKELTLATAESLTGGGIGSALTAVPGASSVFKGGVISYMDQVKASVLGVRDEILQRDGAVSPRTAAAMATGVRTLLNANVAVSVTGLAGPGGDEHGHRVGTVFIGYEDPDKATVREFHFEGSREEIREKTIRSALSLILENL